MFAATSCPGPYLQRRMSELARIVNARLDEGDKPAPAPVPEPKASYQIGDTVTINGVYTSSNSTNKLNPLRNSGTITKIICGAHNPYLLDNGNLGWVNDGCIVSGFKPAPEPVKPQLKDTETIAREVIAGQWGNGSDRKAKLEAAGYNYGTIQDRVNEILLGKSSSSASNKKSNETIAKEVIKGLWGNGADRKNRLTAAGYDYNAVQKIVNNMLK